MKMPPDLMPPGVNFPTSITYTKTDAFTIPEHSLTGTWTSETDSYVFTTNTITTPDDNAKKPMLSVMETKMLMEIPELGGTGTSVTVGYGDQQLPTTIVFQFTDANKNAFTVITYDASGAPSVGTDIYTKQTL